jgi:non-ribosomal peptide synthetase component F
VVGEQVLHRLFEEWVGRRPAALALADQHGHLTYGALHARAQGLAAELRAAGLAPHQPVLVLANRGIDLVVAQLGTLLAGGAFVCVHPDHPASRLRQVVDTAKPAAAVVGTATWARHGEQLAAALPGVPVVVAGQRPDDAAVETPPEAPAEASTDVRPDDLADSARAIAAGTKAGPSAEPSDDDRPDDLAGTTAAIAAGTKAGPATDPQAVDAPEAPADPAVEVGPGDLAYIAFTSGSTGRPKGIPHRHANLAQFVTWQGEAFGIGPGARVAQLAPPGFDVSYCETFGALCRGASLHVVPESARSDAGQLAAWLRDERVTLLQIVPAHWRALLAELGADTADTADTAETTTALPDLATVLFVGEALPPGLVVETRARLRPAPRLVNVYGPTEVVAATFHVVDDVDEGGAADEVREVGKGRSVPIGRPIPGREIVLDHDRGDGEGVGEILIRSPYLTTGYVGGDPEAGRRFASDPSARSASRPSGRASSGPAGAGTGTGVVYRTGDLARRLPGGELVFVGRADNQVKLRGQRVELEDVEAAVVGAGGAGEAVATVRTAADGTQSLVAFVVPEGLDPEDRAGFDPEGLRRRLGAVLPPYMVPSVLVPVDALPRNANGKVDRQVVEEWETAGAGPPRGPGAAAPADADAPVGEVEEAIAAIWCELLGLPAVGRHADLFTLGGDSLLATRIVSRIRTRLGVRVTLGAFFDTPTVAGLAAAAADAPAAPGPALRKQPVG